MDADVCVVLNGNTKRLLLSLLQMIYQLKGTGSRTNAANFSLKLSYYLLSVTFENH